MLRKPISISKLILVPVSWLVKMVINLPWGRVNKEKANCEIGPKNGDRSKGVHIGNGLPFAATAYGQSTNCVVSEFQC